MRGLRKDSWGIVLLDLVLVNMKVTAERRGERSASSPAPGLPITALSISSPTVSILICSIATPNVSELGLFVAGLIFTVEAGGGLHRGSTPNPRPSSSYFQLNLLLLREFERLINEDVVRAISTSLSILRCSYSLEGRTN